MEEEQHGASRAAYGQKLIQALATRLSIEYGTGYGKRNLAYYRKFYLEFKYIEILHTCVQNLTWTHLAFAGFQLRQFYLYFNDLKIVNTRVHNLSWSHFRSIIQVADPKARRWYVKKEV